MNIQKFTQKSVEAVNMCQKLAIEYGNQEIEQEHLLYALLKIDDSLILRLIEKMEINTDHFLNRVKNSILEINFTRNFTRMKQFTRIIKP